MRFHANIKDAAGEPRRLTGIAEEIWHSTPAGTIAEILDVQGPMSLGGVIDAVEAAVRRAPGAFPHPVEIPDLVAALGDLIRLDLVTIKRTGLEAEPAPRVRRHPSADPVQLHPLAAALVEALKTGPASGVAVDRLTRAVQDQRPGNRRMSALDVFNGLGWLLADGGARLDRQPDRAAA